jgi:serine/threonine protein phosphatase PrpC
MGGMMSNPLNAVHIQRRKTADYSLGCASMQGWRPEHEDAHVLSTSFGSTPGCALFGVCDGHAGSRAAAFTAKRLPQLLAEADFSKDTSVISAFLGCDAEYRKEPLSTDGCTAVYCHVYRQPAANKFDLTIMNIGDSRCLLIRPSLVSPGISRDLLNAPSSDDQNPGLVFETTDHKPDALGERSRIEAAGGFVTQDDPPRLDGVIAVSRVIGDFTYKDDQSLPVEKQKMIAVPDVTRISAQEGDILVIACDGLFEGMDSKELARQVILRMHSNHDLGAVAKDLVLHSLGVESKDNMTLMLVLLGGQPQQPQTTADGATTGDVEQEEELWMGDFATHPEQRDKYELFFRKAGFPGSPSPCEVCKRVLRHMSQCPCRTAVYCGTQCQRAAWREHKKKCAAHKSSGKTNSSKH